MDRERVRKQHHSEVPPYLLNVDPSANPAIPLGRLGKRMFDRPHDPFVPNRGAVGPGPSVLEIFCCLEHGGFLNSAASRPL